VAKSLGGSVSDVLGVREDDRVIADVPSQARRQLWRRDRGDRKNVSTLWSC
jgi:hypothetical protein